jgi:hypothetical protein
VTIFQLRLKTLHLLVASGECHLPKSLGSSHLGAVFVLKILAAHDQADLFGDGILRDALHAMASGTLGQVSISTASSWLPSSSFRTSGGGESRCAAHTGDSVHWQVAIMTAVTGPASVGHGQADAANGHEALAGVDRLQVGVEHE